MRPIAILLFILIANIKLAVAKEKDSTSQFLINVDISNLLGKYASGVGFQYEKRSLQLRSHFMYERTGTTGALNINDRFFKPSLGIAYIKTHDRFSFYAGSDVYYTFQKRSRQSVNPFASGIQPLLGFRYPLHKRFFIGTEAKSEIEFYYTETNNDPPAELYKFQLFKTYSILLSYRL